MSSDVAISARAISKNYQIYDRPRDRLLQMFWRNRRQLYREFRALENVSFDVARGETVGIIGRNGSGKSTLLQIVCGTLNPSSGEVVAHGRIAALLELGAGFNPEFTGRENVYISATLHGLSRDMVDERMASIMAFADIGDFIDQPVKSYSSGMFVRLAFAVIAHVDADILIVDEALAVGDAFFTQKCMRFLREFMRTGTVLFVSHDTAAVKALCSRAIWLQNGKVVASGSAKQICDAYLGEMIEASQGTGDGVPAASRVVPVVDTVVSGALATPDVAADLPDKPEMHDGQDGLIYVLPFNAQSSSFGAGGAKIQDVWIANATGERLRSFAPFCQIGLRIDVLAQGPITSPIVGFFIRDRLGQTLFGSNTCMAESVAVPSVTVGQMLSATFEFVFPALPNGDYTVSAAVAQGTQDEHIQLHWVHDAVGIKTQSIHDRAGLVGIPMQSICLKADPMLAV